MLNKFNQTDKKILYNIATGKKSEGLQKSIYYYARMLKKIAKTAKNSLANTQKDQRDLGKELQNRKSQPLILSLK